MSENCSMRSNWKINILSNFKIKNSNESSPWIKEGYEYKFEKEREDFKKSLVYYNN
jgi:hypothetical protein